MRIPVVNYKGCFVKKTGKKTASQLDCSDIMLIFAFIFIADAFSA